MVVYSKNSRLSETPCKVAQNNGSEIGVKTGWRDLAPWLLDTPLMVSTRVEQGSQKLLGLGLKSCGSSRSFQVSGTSDVV